MRYAGKVRNAYRISVRKLQGKRQHGRQSIDGRIILKRILRN
jgi:hypothetical protein